MRDADSRVRSQLERHNVDLVCRHLAMVAIDGASEEVAATLSDDFALHVDQLDTDRWGYLALIDANHAAHGTTRPPLDVTTIQGNTTSVTARLEPLCVAHYRLDGAAIAEAWMTTDWRVWRDWLQHHLMT